MPTVVEFAKAVTDNVETVILGKREQIELLLVALLCKGHVLVEDVPGTGKTMLARAAAASMGVSFSRIQCTPDLLPNDITGVSVFDQRTNEFVFRPGPVFVNVLLADELNRATPRTQAALLEAMQERQVTVDGVSHRLAEPFLVLATQNPIEYEGTFPLPEAQLDRFLIRLPMGYPDEGSEARMLRNLRKRHPIEAVEAVVEGADLLALADQVADVHMEPDLEAYLLAIVRSTRSHPDVSLGASPRGSLAVAATARALAAVRGRDYVLPDDVKAMAPLALAHRLIVKAESQLRGKTAENVIDEILERTPVDLGGPAGG